MTDHDQADDRHAALYLRVSSRSQDFRSQKPDLARWSKSIEGPTVWYEDAMTGTTMSRPGWQALWAAVLTGRVSRVVVWRLDRLGRTARGLTELFDELVTRGVGLVSIKDGLDLATPAGRLMAGVLASVAQYETEVRSERQRAGIAAAKAAGATFGRPKGTGRAITLTAEKVALVRRLKAEGSKVASIARMVGISRQSVYDVVRA